MRSHTVPPADCGQRIGSQHSKQSLVFLRRPPIYAVVVAPLFDFATTTYGGPQMIVWTGQIGNNHLIDAKGLNSQWNLAI